MKYLFIVTFLLSAVCNVFAQKKSVYVFLGTECPLSREQTFNLRNAYQKYGEEVAFFAVFPNESDSKEMIDRFAKKYEIPFSLIADYQHKWVDSLSAAVTPEVFILDKNGEILYSGKIDNRMVSLGVKRKVVTENYLDQVLTEVLADKEISIDKTIAIGCRIFRKM